jgi:hypothetical protein
MYRYLLLMMFLFACLTVKAQSPQTTEHRSKADSLNMKRDSLLSKPFVPKVKPDKIYYPDSTHSPHKAVMRSLMFPGLGQIYNKNGLWWRLPLIYGGLGTLIYNIYTNGKDYNVFLKESIWRENGRPPATDSKGKPIINTTPDNNGNIVPSGEPLPYYQGSFIANVDDQTIYDFKDNLRRNRDLSIFGLVGAWGVNMIDAYVSAKFIHSYTMDNNLSIKITPTMSGMPGTSVYASNFNTTFTPALKITFLFR